MSIGPDLKRARSRGVPIVAIATPDESATLAEAVAQANGTTPAVIWDVVRGLTPGNPQASSVVRTICGDADPTLFTDPATALGACLDRLPEAAMVLCRGGHRLTQEPRCVQALVNLRDAFKTDGRTVVLLGPGFTFAPEIAKDTLLLEEKLPLDPERESVISKLASEAGVELNGTLPDAVRATRGLSRFAVEQVAALALEKTGLNLASLRKRWRQAVNATAGLTVDESGTTLDNVAGLGAFKDFARRLTSGRDKPDAIVRIDEIEKALAGAGGNLGDSSGVSQGILGTLLTWLQEKGATGLIALGPPGAGKSLCSAAMGAAGGVPTITLDVGALKGSLVGQSEERVRDALRTIEALAGRTFWVASCNSIAALPPELRRRFTYGIWFFDLPTGDELKALWRMYADKYELKDKSFPESQGWTGAEVKSCCEIAYRFGCSTKEAAQWIVPVSKASAEQIETLRKNAEGRYLSASRPGAYTRNAVPQAPRGRRLEV